MQTKTDILPSASVDRPVPVFSKEARGLLANAAPIERNALDQVSHAVYFR